MNGAIALRDVVDCPELLPVIVPIYNEMVEAQQREADAVNRINRNVACQDTIQKLRRRTG